MRFSGRDTSFKRRKLCDYKLSKIYLTARLISKVLGRALESGDIVFLYRYCVTKISQNTGLDTITLIELLESIDLFTEEPEDCSTDHTVNGNIE